MHMSRNKHSSLPVLTGGCESCDGEGCGEESEQATDHELAPWCWGKKDQQAPWTD